MGKCTNKVQEEPLASKQTPKLSGFNDPQNHKQ